MAAYYNEHDKFAAAWLRILISEGHIAPGEVDERDIQDVRPSDLRGFTQAHFFAGIGGWSLAARLAGWPDERPLWTGSCPCQPFSTAGKGGGFDDERHLWPAFFHLIRELRPAIVAGEQVAGKPGLTWLDLVQCDLEGEGYASGSFIIPACAVGAPHRRNRLWWVGMANAEHGARRELGELGAPQGHGIPKISGQGVGLGLPRGSGADDVLAHDERFGRKMALLDAGSGAAKDGEREASESRVRGSGGVAHGDVERPLHERPCGLELGDAGSSGLEGRDVGTLGREFAAAERAGSGNPWAGLEWLPCRDGKIRPTQSGFQPVAYGLWPSLGGDRTASLFPLATTQPNRVGILRGAGNAIVSQVGAEILKAVMSL